MCSYHALDGEHSTFVNEDRSTSVDRSLSLDDLEREISSLAAHLAAATCRWLLLIAEFDAREGWADSGCASCAHWLSWRCGIGLGAAREHVRVGRAVAILPLVRAGFGNGELSYTKVRAITRVADSSTEAQLVEFARHATGGQLERIVCGYRSALTATTELAARQETSQSLNWMWDEDGMLSVRARLRPEDGAAFLAALTDAEALVAPAVMDDLGVGARQAQALVALAVAPAKDAQPHELVMHVDADSLAADRIIGRSDIEDGPTIPPETMRRLGCDSAIVSMIERDGTPLSVGRRTRVIPPALRRALRSRDGEHCRFPGCTHERHLHAHHIRHWARGGPTALDNLVQLCSHHHRLVHEGGYRVWCDDRRQLRFASASGRELPATFPAAPARGLGLEQQNFARHIRVDERTCVPRSGGAPCDYGIAVEGLCRLAGGP